MTTVREPMQHVMARIAGGLRNEHENRSYGLSARQLKLARDVYGDYAPDDKMISAAHRAIEDAGWLDMARTCIAILKAAAADSDMDIKDKALILSWLDEILES